MQQTLLSNAAAVSTLMLITWLASVAYRNASIVDAVWGLGFVLIAWVTWLNGTPDQRSLLLPVIISVWGLRLSLHLAWRNHGKPEDFRYAAMRQHHGDRFWLVSLITVFLLQGVIMWLVALPVQMCDSEKSNFGLAAILGGGLWLTGVFFEIVGDWQLAEFRKNPDNKGKVLNRGLWRYTRHPNYFGDFCHWWGVFSLAISCGAPAWTVVGPALMSILLLKVSGVTLLEKTLTESKAEYSDYVRSTNAFFPGPARK